jgi:hypothetical protein
LRECGTVPSDARLAIWRYVPGANAPVPPGKTELAIVVPATEEFLKQAREAYGGVPVLPIVLGDAEAPAEAHAPVHMTTLDDAQLRKALVPRLVDRLWERRLALGRALPATRDHITWLLIQRAIRDMKVLLGSVAGAGTGRSGVPTPATAQLLIHQASLIVAIGAVYGAEIEDKGTLIKRVTPHLTPTLVLDLAEAQATRLAEGLAGEKGPKTLYGTAAAVITRPALSASSTLLAGIAARRAFRERPSAQSALARVATGTRDLGKRALTGFGQGVVAVAGALMTRVRHADTAAASAAPEEASEAAGSEHGLKPIEIERAPEDQAS